MENNKFEQQYHQTVELVISSDQVPNFCRERLLDILQDKTTMKIAFDYLQTPEAFIEWMINKNEKYNKSPMFLTSRELQALFTNIDQGIFL